MLGALYLAQDLYVPPATESAREVASLFNITLWIALVVWAFVTGLLLYIIIKFRKNTKVPRDETHRGHTTAEVVWTVVPAAILLFLGFLSAGTLIKIDVVPEDTDFTVKVGASQFTWTFTYPDGNRTINDLRLQEGSRVRVELTSLDVIHAFAVPEFAIKQDAVPGKTHTSWFDVPRAGAGTTEFFIQCMEYCGVGHHDMRAKITVFPAGSQPLPYGRAPPPAAPSG